MIRVEIITVTEAEITVALYYPVPGYLYSAASVDDDRTPAGAGLNAGELILLKEGRLYEVIRTIDPEATTEQEMKVALETLWDATETDAHTEYKQRYSYLNLPDLEGSTWNGGIWT